MTERLGPTPQPRIQSGWLSETDPPPRAVDDPPAAPTGNYEVGYKKPPKHGQFKKGQSGNRKGRPKGSKNPLIELRRALDQQVWVTENGKRKRIKKIDLAFTQLVNKAAAGDPPALLTIIKLLPLLGIKPEGDGGKFTLIIEGA
jgi:hypothetical protein